jgi:hypothetical protein
MKKMETLLTLRDWALAWIRIGTRACTDIANKFPDRDLEVMFAGPRSSNKALQFSLAGLK